MVTNITVICCIALFIANPSINNNTIGKQQTTKDFYGLKIREIGWREWWGFKIFLLAYHREFAQQKM